MTAKLFAWLFGTSMGRGVLLGGSLTLGLALGWLVFAAHYEAKGKADCEAAAVSAALRANVEQAERNAAAAATGSKIGRETQAAADTVVKQADASAIRTEGEIVYVYRDPPRTAPVAFGSCVHPVDDRVQSGIERAVREANAAGGAL